MILMIDVQYHLQGATAVGGLINDWQSTQFDKTYTIDIKDVLDYQAGQFYQRELPCILQLLDVIEEHYDYIIIDGYVFLSAEQSPGLGFHLWDALTIKKPIIGVAKNFFKDTPHNCEILRGKSQKPLFITSIGIDLIDAKQNILKMSGEHRLPDLIKKVDLLTKQKGSID